MKCQNPVVWGKIRKITINLPSAEFAHRVVKVKHANDHI